MTWTLRYFIVMLAVVAAILAFGLVTYPSQTDQCIFLQVYGIGEGKVTQPLPCDWMGVRYAS